MTDVDAPNVGDIMAVEGSDLMRKVGDKVGSSLITVRIGQARKHMPSSDAGVLGKSA